MEASTVCLDKKWKQRCPHVDFVYIQKQDVPTIIKKKRDVKLKKINWAVSKNIFTAKGGQIGFWSNKFSKLSVCPKVVSWAENNANLVEVLLEILSK